MFPKMFLLVVSVLVLASLACGVTFNLPVTDLKTVPEQTEVIRIPLPDSDEVVDLELAFGAGELRVNPGASAALVEGEAVFNVLELRPEVIVNDGRVRIETGDLEISGIPDFSNEFRNEWDLRLNDTRPISLKINAGAYQGRIELGGLPLVDLRVADGAADVRLNFSQPNPVAMDTLRYETGASSVELSGLGNANFDNLIFKGGAGDYRLDFSGDLRRDATVNIDAGISSVKIVVPQGTNARLFYNGGLSDIDLSGAWEKENDAYYMNGEGPRLTINVDIAAGSLQIDDR